MSSRTDRPVVVLDAADLGDTGRSVARASERLLKLLIWGLTALLMVSILGFGAVRGPELLVFELGSAALLALWGYREYRAAVPRVLWNEMFGPFLLCAAVALIQIVFRLTAYRYATKQAALMYAACGALMFVAAQVFDRHLRAREFLETMTVFGLLLSFAAIIQWVTHNPFFFLLQPPKEAGQYFGSYINHNHYAGLMELLWPAALLLALNQRYSVTRRMIYGVAAFFMAGSIFLSMSRGGMLACVVQVVALGLVMMARTRERAVLWVYVAGVLVAGGIAIWYGGNDVVSQIASLSTPGAERVGMDRIRIYRDSIHMIAAKPFLGWGLGTFPIVYPRFRSFYTDAYVNAAHNDYIQFVSEMGFAAATSIVWFVVLLVRTGIHRVQRLRNAMGGGLRLAGVLGCLGILVHSFLDFNLQIPANAALFFIMAVLATAVFPSNAVSAADADDLYGSPGEVLGG